MDQGRVINVTSDGSWTYGMRNRSMRGKMKQWIMEEAMDGTSDGSGSN